MKFYFSKFIIYIMDFDFYDEIQKPLYAPDRKIFRPVWTFLYVLMGVSFVIFYFQPMSLAKFFGIPLFFLQLILNLLWTPLFFKYKKIGLALVDLFFLLVTVIVMTGVFFGISFILGVLQIPYIIWLFIAFRLNFDIFQLNK